MQIMMPARARSTGFNHTVTDETIEPANVELEKNGQVTVGIDIGPTGTSGSFEDKPTLSLSKPYTFTGTLEQTKLELLMKRATP